MPSQLVCRPDRSLPVAVLTVTGVLDTITSGALHHAVFRCLSARPQALLIDVAELDVRDPTALDVLSEVVNRTAHWPATPIVLCSASAKTAEQLAGSKAHDCVAVAGDCAEVLRQTTLTAGPRPVRARLRPVPDACRQARQLVTQACAAWQLTELTELTATATLIVTELVANVVRHAHTTMELTVGLRNGRIQLAVRDGCPALPRSVDPGLRDAGGRGLRLVRELTDSWGVLPVHDGKVVWTTLMAGAPA
jgi:anti-sigma regulatory factor (Ser/Thr protein kinase)/anti-anti-sigma regulatory factor